MKIIKYQIQSLIYVKAEITKLVPLPINNISDNYYLIIPTIISNLPDNVMFIQETMLVPPHGTVNYIPKLVKLGITLSQSIATQLPKGIEINLIVIDNINNIGAINNVVRHDEKVRDVNINHNTTIISDGTISKVDQQRKELLNVIDNVIAKNESITSDQNNINNNSLKTIISEYEIPVEKQYSLNDNKNTLNNINEYKNININNDSNDNNIQQVKRRPGRPRRNPINVNNNEAKQEFQNLLLNNN